MDQARAHCARGAGIWEWAGTENGGEPDVVLACAGDVPTQEILAAAQLLRRHRPELAVRVVNVVDMTTLLPRDEHPHGMPDLEYDGLLTARKPVIFAYHGYPWLIHRPAYRRSGHANLHVRGYRESGTTTTPFDMVVRNDLDRYRLVMDVIDRVPGLAVRPAAVRQTMADARTRHHAWIREHGTDLPEVADFPGKRPGRRRWWDQRHQLTRHRHRRRQPPGADHLFAAALPVRCLIAALDRPFVPPAGAAAPTRGDR